MIHLLIVDDNETNIDLLEQVLEDDFKLTVARSGKEAVALAMSVQPDLILMDIAMPEMDGTQAMKLIKADTALAQVPIVAVTSHAMRGDRADMLESGFDDYLSKPVDDELLFETIKRLLPEGG